MSMGCVLIAGSFTTAPRESGGNIGRAVGPQPVGRLYDGNDEDEIPKGNLRATRMDVINFKTSSQQKMGSWRPFALFDKEGDQLRKSEVVQSLKDLFASKDHSWAQVYYTGHGTPDEGAWCFENSSGEVVEYLRFEDFLELWKARPRTGPKHLSMILDCCFSGACG